jgi:16S rRNA (guanine527-N7)-methyltransferase
MTPEQEGLLKKYVEAVLAAPAHLHLTSDRDFQLFWNRHILDAITLHELIPPPLKRPSNKILDVGSGNGIPGIPISIIEPSWNVDLLDSDNKKFGFIDTFISSNAINNAHIVIGRAETLSHTKMRSSYNIVFARALSKIRVAVELCAAFLKIGGILIVPHGTSWEDELGNNADSLDILGLDMPEPIIYKLGNVEYTAIIFTKISDTPKEYPRSVGIPAKRPL